MEAKISEGPDFTILYFHKAHSATDHVCDKDRSKYLKFQQKSVIANAVKVAPLQTSEKSVARLVRK